MKLLVALLILCPLVTHAKSQPEAIIIRVSEMNQKMLYRIEPQKNKTLLTQMTEQKSLTSHLPAQDFKWMKKVVAANKPAIGKKCFNHAQVVSKEHKYDVCLEGKDAKTLYWRKTLRGLASLTRIHQKIKK